MVFNLQKFLIENRLTKRARLDEDAMTKTDAEQQAMGAEEDVTGDEEMFDDEETDSWYKDDEIGGSDEFEGEPAGKDIGSSEPAMRGLAKKQADLKALEDVKDSLLMQLKSGQLSLDQYKQAIESYEMGNGKRVNIPQEIKKLRVDIAKEADPIIGDTEEEI